MAADVVAADGVAVDGVAADGVAAASDSVAVLSETSVKAGVAASVEAGWLADSEGAGDTDCAELTVDTAGVGWLDTTGVD